jgi:regulator of sigma E protease
VFAAILSINLAVLNMLPVPMLDGFQIVVETLESLSGRRRSEVVQRWTARAGVAIVTALVLVALVNDLTRSQG